MILMLAFLEERWERATWRGSDSASSIACTPLRKSLSVSLPFSLSPSLWDFFTVAAFCNKYPKLQLATHTRAMVANYLASIFGSAEVVKNR